MPPLYEFECSKCGTKSEKLVKMDTDHIECTCGSKAIKVTSLPANPQFHGGGWTPKFHRKMERGRSR